MARRPFILSILVLSLLIGCQPGTGLAPDSPTSAKAVTAVAYLPLLTSTYICADLDAAWGNWPKTILVLEALIDVERTCGPEPLASKLYAAHFNYGVGLEGSGQTPAAVQQYLAAFNLDPLRAEAWNALVRLNSLPPPIPLDCPAAPAPLGPPAAVAGPFAAVQGREITLGGQPYPVRGVNYYPRYAAWHDFLLEGSLADMATELDLVQQAGFNTLRVFLWYDALFFCRPEDAVPNAARFALFDGLLALARARGFHLIVTLNDLPDLTYRPLYTDWARYDAQTDFIVQRYRDDPTILAWDLRNEGDLDVGSRFTEDQVIAWLAHASQRVNALDTNHLVTAGWLGNSMPTSPYVDFMCIHHWSTAAQLQPRVAYYRDLSPQPLLLEEVGFHSWAQDPTNPRDEATQASLLGSVIAQAEAEELAGWLVWTAFNFAPPPGQGPTNEHFFGLWRVDLSPKPALAALPLH